MITIKKAKIVKLPDGRRGHIYKRQPLEDRIMIHLVDENDKFIINGAGKPATVFKKPEDMKGVKVIGFMD